MIKEYLDQFDLDVRKHKDARFMDQKCTPDVVCIIADCVINLVGDDHKKSFFVSDIWDSDYFIKNVKQIFNKPSADNPTTNSEYDKFIQQPLRMLAYAKVLNITKAGNSNVYSISNYKILEYISLRDRNAYNFLCLYLEKVLKDSGMYKHFEEYEQLYNGGKLDRESFLDLKEKYQKFILGNTKISGVVEINRIFPKVLNIFATSKNLPGTVKGNLSEHQFYYTDLMYNRKNWRDLDKAKNVSRQEAEKDNDGLNSDDSNALNDYLVQKAMNTIKKLYQQSEVKDQWGNGEATQVHHIFPKHKFPQLAHYLENLIKLTATQHFTKAHPNNKTSNVSSDYQLVCLLAKSISIENSLKKNEPYYRKESYIYCINEGLNANLSLSLTFKEVRTQLAQIYNDI